MIIWVQQIFQIILQIFSWSVIYVSISLILYRKQMIRAQSALMRNTIAIDSKLELQNQKGRMLRDDRSHFLHQAQEIKLKHQKEIEKLKEENQQLQLAKEQLMLGRKSLHLAKDLRGSGLGQRGSISSIDQNYLRTLLDKQRYQTKLKKKLLLTLQDIMKEGDALRAGNMEENPSLKTIQQLENKLDAVTIKCNQTKAIQHTYEAIVSKLKEENVSYNNQLADIERCIKGKQQDYQELMLLSHDATHAKEESYADLKRLEVRRLSVQEIRGVHLNRKKEKINQENCQNTEHDFKTQKSDYDRKSHQIFAPSYKQDENCLRQELSDYQTAMAKLKKVTGVSDPNEIIQKFKAQGLTSSALETLQSANSIRILELKALKQQHRAKLDAARFVEEKERVERNRFDQIQEQLAKGNNQYERISLKNQALSAMMVSINAGIKHLRNMTQFYQIDNEASGTFEDDLKTIQMKIVKIFGILSSDPNFMKSNHNSSAQAIRLLMKGKGLSPNNQSNKN